LKARTPLLLKGLKDTVEENQLLAINGLMLNPDLDAVPDIIESLNSAYANVRAVARKALEEIKKHYEDQAEWKRWYDETKKALKR
jgi:HEAT repeat protein